jgi:hypothetical protein
MKNTLLTATISLTVTLATLLGSPQRASAG